MVREIEKDEAHRGRTGVDRHDNRGCYSGDKFSLPRASVHGPQPGVGANPECEETSKSEHYAARFEPTCRASTALPIFHI